MEQGELCVKWTWSKVDLVLVARWICSARLGLDQDREGRSEHKVEHLFWDRARIELGSEFLRHLSAKIAILGGGSGPKKARKIKKLISTRC